MKALSCLVVLGATLATGCASSNLMAMSQRSGKIYPNLAGGCPVRFENLSYLEAFTRFEQVGLVTLSGATTQPQAWEGETKEKLWPKVCEIGGTIVTMNAATNPGYTVNGQGMGVIQFMVWRELEPQQERPVKTKSKDELTL